MAAWRLFLCEMVSRRIILYAQLNKLKGQCMEEKEIVIEEDNGGDKKSVQKPKRPFPRIPLEDCLLIAQKIRELNGGNPWSPNEVSKAINIGFSTNNFVYFLNSSKEFGLTSGTKRAKNIALEDLGKKIVYSPDPETERKAKVEAFLKVPIFKQVLEHYKGAKLPEMTYLKNTLESTFKLNPLFHEEFVEIYSKNCQYIGISVENFLPVEDFKNNIAHNHKLYEQKEESGESKILFVAMPFSEKTPERPNGFFSEVLENLIKSAAESAGFSVKTANKKGNDIIHSTIINDLLDSDIVLADLTDHNPNVLFELGLRMAENKPVIIVKAKGTGAIFDVDNMMRYFEYNPNLWKSTLKNDVPKLAEFIKESWDQRKTSQTYYNILRKRNA